MPLMMILTRGALLGGVFAAVALVAPLDRALASESRGSGGSFEVGRRLYLNGRFRAAIPPLERALAATESGAQVRAQIWLYLALSHHALDQLGAAENAFIRALESDPGLRLDPRRFKPELVEFFERIRVRVAPASQPASRPAAPVRAAPGRPPPAGPPAPVRSRETKRRPTTERAARPSFASRRRSTTVTLAGGLVVGLDPALPSGQVQLEVATNLIRPWFRPRLVSAFVLPTSQKNEDAGIERVQGVLRLDAAFRYWRRGRLSLQSAFGGGLLLSSVRASDFQGAPRETHAGATLALAQAVGLSLASWISLRLEIVAQLFPLRESYRAGGRVLGRSPRAEIGLNLGLELGGR